MKGIFTLKALRNKFLAVAILLSFVQIAPMSAQAQRMKYSEVKIYASREDIRTLQQAGMEFDHFSYNKEEGTINTTLSEADLVVLRRLPFKFVVTESDAEAAFLKRSNITDFYKSEEPASFGPSRTKLSFFDAPSQNMSSKITTPTAFTPGTMGGYHTWDEMRKEIDSMKMNYPSLVRLDTIGYTTQGRPLVSVKISDNVNTDEAEPEILFTGMHHAREPLGMENLIFYMQYLLENYSSNPRIKELVDSREQFFIPCMNPDGYERNRVNSPSGGGLHRKNMGPYGTTANPGTDLNRNYGVDFGLNNTGSSGTNSADNYRGPSAFSEVETQVLRNYARTRRFTLMINHHSYGGYWINSYSSPTRTLTAAQATYAATSGNQMCKYNFYEVGTPLQTVGYEANGSSDDWFFIGDIPNIGSVPCFSPEIGLGITTFWPASSTIIPFCKEAFFGNLQAALIAGSYAKLEDRTAVNLASLSTQAQFTVRRLGNLDSSVRVTVLPLVNVQSVGSPVTISSLPNYLDTVQRSIAVNIKPSISNGNIVKWIYKIETGGTTILDTVSYLYNAINVFSDNMDAGSFTGKWTATGTWGFSTTSTYAGARSVTESPAGNYANSASSTLTSVTIDLSSSTAAYLSFWIRYNAENGYDRLRVAARSTATGGTYVNLSGINTVTENALNMGNQPGFTGRQDYWVRERINLSQHLGASNVQIQFSFASNASVQADGFYIDELTVTKSTLTTLPAYINGFYGKVTQLGNELSWDAVTDASHDYFELERSADGRNFTVLSKITVVDTRSFVDANPVNGTNYYRLKQVDKGGNIVYSNIVQLLNAKEKKITVAPTLATSNIFITIENNEAEKLSVEVIDSYGRMLKQQLINSTIGTQKLTMDITSLPAQQYFVKVRNQKNEVLLIQQIIKQ